MTTIGKGAAAPLELLARWSTSGLDCFLAQREATEHNEAAALVLVGRELTAEERAGDVADVRARADDMASTIVLAEVTRRQTTKALFFANALVRGLSEALADPEVRKLPGAQLEHLEALCDGAKLIVENFGGGESGV